ncbi:hypothetical protein K435DRAFT_322756 [Dendrothele bispora CBS 962.96]|uniref:Uncharacterized protein n=1 Tax=Dendrothele bispora (strain CBS 962.96) TaxID=1314807 RepID=A0A4S8MJA2_DENBC|nr:hypothetical protein K435DRAFT_322756 [Dendrothele bispora CBS 962.96]
MLLLPWKEASRFWIDAEGMDDVNGIMDDIADGTIPPLKSDNIPAFLTQWSKHDPKQMLRGLLLGSLLIAALKAIFIGPSSALEPKLMATKAGNAKLHHIKSVSIPLLQYTIAQVHSFPLRVYDANISLDSVCALAVAILALS